MPEGERREGTEISTLLAVPRRRLATIVISVAVAASAAYAVSEAQDREYSATAQLLLQGTAPGQPGEPFSSPLPAAAPDRESLVLSGDVLRRVQRRLERRTSETDAAEIVSNLSASSGQDSNIVEIEATAPGPKLAAFAANALATENIAFRRDTALKKIRNAQRATQAELARFRGGRNSPAPSQLLQQLADLRGAAATNDGDAVIVKRAAAPSSPSSPKPKRNLLIGAFGGLLFGLALALIREQLDRRVRHAKELEETFGLPVLATVRKSPALARSNGALGQLPPHDKEAFQILRANLHYLNTDRELRSVVVTSVGVGDGKSTVALNLAKADASIGKKVLLVEADVRRPGLAPLLGIQVSQGLTTFLSERSVKLADVTYRVPVLPQGPGRAAPLTMDVVVAGNTTDNPSELMESKRMRELIREGEAYYDLVVVDTAPAAMVADPIPLMAEASAVVIVGHVGKITSAEADNLREQLERIAAPAFGLVANFARGPGKYGYY